MEERLDRQLRIQGWNQQKLNDSSVALIGDNLILNYLTVSCAALGINRSIILKNNSENNILSYDFIDLAKAINQKISYLRFHSYFVNKLQKEFISKADLLVDINGFSISKRLSLEFLFDNKKEGLIVNPSFNEIKMYHYKYGRENEELLQVIPKNPLPHKYTIDPILSIIAGGLILEEIKNILMQHKTSTKIINYSIERLNDNKEDYSNKRVLVVGAGALGTFVAISLASIDVGQIVIIDPDIIEETNLNRQILFYNSVGKPKAKTLANRISNDAVKVKSKISKFSTRTKISNYDCIFDCVDNLETRIILSDACESEKIPLVSGGTSYYAGQVTTYVPEVTQPTKKNLDLENIIKERQQVNRESCIYQPDPSVIMSNQIVGGVMVNEFRKISYPNNYINEFKTIRYDANDDKRINML